MKLYVTFGQVHSHHINGRTFDKDCIAEIDCDSYEEGRARAFELFGDKFHRTLDILDSIDPDIFPRGIIPIESEKNRIKFADQQEPLEPGPAKVKEQVRAVAGNEAAERYEKNFRQHNSKYGIDTSSATSLVESFIWSNTPEGHGYWSRINRSIYEQTQPEPEPEAIQYYPGAAWEMDDPDTIVEPPPPTDPPPIDRESDEYLAGFEEGRIVGADEALEQLRQERDEF